VAASSAPFESSLQRGSGNGAGGGRMTLCLGHDCAMVGAVRHALRRWLHERGCTTTHHAVLVLSELVTKATVHAGAGCTSRCSTTTTDCDSKFEIRARRPRSSQRSARTTLGGEVTRCCAAAGAWGWEPTVDGKRVWASLDAPVKRTDTASTPNRHRAKRSPRRHPARGVVCISDVNTTAFLACPGAPLEPGRAPAGWPLDPIARAPSSDADTRCRRSPTAPEATPPAGSRRSAGSPAPHEHEERGRCRPERPPASAITASDYWPTPKPMSVESFNQT
jgi:hypothetical protein